MSYLEQLENKKFRGNVVIGFIGQYFAIRLPDSGLSIPVSQRGMVSGVVLNPTTVDLKRVSQTIANYSFKLVDKNNVITGYVGGRADALINQDVDIWIGRSGVGMDFSQYFKLPTVKIKKVDHNSNEYNFSASEATDRMNVKSFDLKGKLFGDILAATTVITLQEDIAAWPTSGLFKIDDEFISYSGVDVPNKQLTGCLRGLKLTTAADHPLGANVQYAYDISGNPIDILLQLLVSDGGGGPYDVLPFGLGIPENLIDIAEIEDLRDNVFAGQQYSFTIYNLDPTLDFIENEILMPSNLRFKTSDAAKISLALLNQAQFGLAEKSIDEDAISSYPQWQVDDNKIVNVIQIEWDYNEATKNYDKVTTYRDEESILNFGERDTYVLQFKGIRDALSGQDILDDNAARFLARFGTPNPEVSFKSHINKHPYNVGDKVLVQSKQIPDASGSLLFASELEVISRGINFQTGDVNFRLAFTSYTGIRGCYISPVDFVLSFSNQKTITVPSGRGASYTKGWRMRLWNDTSKAYEPDAFNVIASIVGDVVTFENNWTTTLIAGVHKIKFVDYDDATPDQKRYCFIGYNGANFDDGSKPYQILF